MVVQGHIAQQSLLYVLAAIEPVGSQNVRNAAIKPRSTMSLVLGVLGRLFQNSSSHEEQIALGVYAIVWDATLTKLTKKQENVMWSIEKNYHASGVIELFEQDGVPVLVAQAGRYPDAVSDDGRSTKETPHVLISVHKGVAVYAIGEWHHSYRRQLKVFAIQDDACIDEMILVGKSKIKDAICELQRMNEKYDEAAEIVTQALKYEKPFARDEYEVACVTCSVEPMSDADCLGYGVKYGDFTFPEYTAKHIVKMHLAMRRMQWLMADEANNRALHVATLPESKLQKGGQLWEPCERCGAEPVYMPLHLCDKCWLK